MPSSLETPVLQVDANVIHKVDTSNPQNLFSMWTVFARCADSVAQGRRLENLSWRLWTRETFCVDSATCIPPHEAYDAAASTNLSASATSKPTTIPSGHSQRSTEELPQLSGSVDSVADDEAVELPAQPGAVEIIRPRILRQDSCGSNRSRGRERHITSDDLEKMVVSIVCEQEPLKAPLRSIPSFTSQSAQQTEAPAPVLAQPVMVASPAAIQQQQPETHVAKAPSPEETQQPTEAPAAQPIPTPKHTTTVIRGFSPSFTPATMPRIVATLAPSVQQPAKATDKDDANAIPEPTSAPAAKPVVSKKATFALGGSSSCEDSLSDPSQSLEMRKNSVSMTKRKLSGVASGLSHAAGSSKNARAEDEEGGSLKSAMHLPRHGQATPFAAQKKQTSFSNQLMTRTIPSSSAVFDDDDQTDSDDIDESAIDDDEDDSSDWEDQNEESGRSSVDDKTMFQRVDSTVHLPSRRSLITLMLQKSEQEVKNGLTMSQSTMALPRAHTVHNGSLAPSPNDSDEATRMMRPRVRGPQSNLRPINEIPRSAAMPIMSTATAGGNYQAAYSPRTNRRNMLSTELTESLRRQLLWERSHKTSTANAVLKRRHTSHDVANLKQYPEVPHMKTDYDASSWDQYLNRDAFNGYHAKGW